MRIIYIDEKGKERFCKGQGDVKRPAIERKADELLFFALAELYPAESDADLIQTAINLRNKLIKRKRIDKYEG